MERNEATSRTEAERLHLKPYGYAPGSYTKKCLFCDSIMRDVDKAATQCRYCAEQKHAEVSAAPPVAPQTEAERLAQALTNPRRWHELTDDECDSAAAELRRLSADARRWQWIRKYGGAPWSETDPTWTHPDVMDIDADHSIKVAALAQLKDTP